ncbi:type III pantothenate kinase [Salinisphaera aquimarina]|uniref:Type III pantothenate kinase n=1 Tax=Salinisphaera aquimarina TaxID=2094031 RepID=A0ABV7ESE6_9GAMM
MNLLIDIGNTRVKWALARGHTLAETGAIWRARHPDWTARLPSDSLDGIYVASVADDSAIQALRIFAADHALAVHRVVSTARSGPLVNAYARPERLGVDRWMACVAAQARAEGSVLIADVGTALTLDWVGADGVHGGGLIAPGVNSMRLALRNATQLRPTHVPDEHAWLARDTDSAIAAGTLRCAIAVLDSAALDLAPDRLLLTGGEAELLAPRLARPWQVVPHLVLEGLAVHAEREARGGQPARQRSE